MIIKRLLYCSAFLFTCTFATAQDEDLFAELDAQDSNKVSYVAATFKGTRLISLPTVEVMGKNTLEFRIAHRFGDAATNTAGASTIFGLDGPVALDLSFDYSLSDRLSIGLSRTNIQKLVSGNVKYKILRQTTTNKTPITVTYLGKMNITHEKKIGPRYDEFANRMSYVNQLMIARKFNASLSLQLDLIHVHRNLVKELADKNSMFAMGLSGRMKLTKRVSLTAEYVYRFGDYAINRKLFYDHLGVGVDIETGGHVFQLFVVNSFTTNEAQFVPTNDRNWGDGAVRFGFNVSRVFSY